MVRQLPKELCGAQDLSGSDHFNVKPSLFENSSVHKMLCLYCFSSQIK